MKRYPPNPSIPNNQLIELFRTAFRNRIASLTRGNAVVKVPPIENLYERREDMTYHFKPELFIQTGGATDFTFPQSKLYLRPDEIGIIPNGVPHSEKALTTPTTFENIVVCFYSKTTTIHRAAQDSHGLPYATDILFYQSPLFNDMLALLKLSSSLYHSDLPNAPTSVKGLLIALFAMLLDLLSSEQEDHNPQTQRVYQCQWEIRNHLNNSDLSVQWLAEKLNCSANYLSKVFHDEIGEKIITYIARVRLDNAVAALNDTSLSIKEISNACGFRDPNYFSRVFKQKYELTPKEFRAQLVAQVRQPESKPKAVQGDYEEHHFGYDKNRNLIQGI